MMYKVQGKNNKVIFRLQDFTAGDNVDESKFVEGRNSQGKTRLQCEVLVMHPEEIEALQHNLEQSKQHVEELNNTIMQKDNEIKKLKQEIAGYKRANIDERAQLQGEKFNMLVSHQKEVDELKEMHANELFAIDETHKETLKNMRVHYTARIDKANEKFNNEVQANKQASDKLRGEMLTLNETHKAEVINLQKQHHHEVEKLQHDLQAQQEQHAYDIDKLKTAIADGKQEHLTEVGNLKEKHHVEVDEMRSKFLELLTLEHAQDIADFNDCGELPFYIKPFARGFVKSFEEFKMRKQTNTPKKIVESYKLTPARDE